MEPVSNAQILATRPCFRVPATIRLEGTACLLLTCRQLPRCVRFTFRRQETLAAGINDMSTAVAVANGGRRSWSFWLVYVVLLQLWF